MPNQSLPRRSWLLSQKDWTWRITLELSAFGNLSQKENIKYFLKVQKRQRGGRVRRSFA